MKNFLIAVGFALNIVGLLVVVSTGAAEVQSDNVLQEAIYAIADDKNPFHGLALSGFIMCSVGSALILFCIFWIIFGGSGGKSAK